MANAFPLQAPAPTSRTTEVRTWPAGFDGHSAPAEYQAVSYAGCGSFSEVWRVSRSDSDQHFALKQLRTDWEEQRVARSLLANEAEAGRRIVSAHVVRILDARLELAPRYVVMEWLEGMSLEKLLETSGRFCCNQALWIARQCAQGLADLHAGGLLHGDIKPANVFVCDDGTVKLIDLGFSRALAGDAPPQGMLTGTPEYMAPETLAGGKAGGKFSGSAKDVYSLGIVLYRMLSGRLPFQGDVPVEILREHQQSIAPDLRHVAPDVPREVSDLVTRLLSKQPLRRVSATRELVRELLRLELASLSAELEGAGVEGFSADGFSAAGE